MNIPTIPNNSLTKEITEIVELSRQLEENYDYNPPATEEEIVSWENEHQVKIPDSVKDWLRFSNGSDIQNGLMVSYSISNFVVGCDAMPEDLIIIGNVIGDGEFICFSKKTEKIIWEDHGKLKEYDNMNGILKRIINIM